MKYISYILVGFKQMTNILTAVLYNAFEVVGHYVAQGTFVGQTQAVRKHNSGVHNHAVNKLANTEQIEPLC